jgi:hypothetical protein
MACLPISKISVPSILYFPLVFLMYNTLESGRSGSDSAVANFLGGFQKNTRNFCVGGAIFKILGPGV